MLAKALYGSTVTIITSYTSSSSPPLHLGRWPVIPVRLSIFSTVDLGFSSLQGSRHGLSLLVDLQPFSICACSIRFSSFVPTILCSGSHMFPVYFRLYLTSYTEAAKRILMDCGEDGARGFSLSFYCYISLQPRQIYVGLLLPKTVT
jgi:hypothetical protein